MCGITLLGLFGLHRGRQCEFQIARLQWLFILAPLLGAEPAIHEVRLVALAFARDRAPATFEATDAVVAHAADDSCTCGEATHSQSWFCAAQRSSQRPSCLASRIAPIGAVRVRVNQFADGQPVC